MQKDKNNETANGENAIIPPKVININLNKKSFIRTPP